MTMSKALNRVLAALLAGTALLAGGACARLEPRFRNVILFIGDGMSVECQVSLSRYLYGRDDGLSWHSLPGRAYLATWDVTAYNIRARKEKKPLYRAGAFDPRLGYDAAREGRTPPPLSAAGPGPSFRLPATDSASAATAFAAGIKTDSGNIAWLPGDPENGRVRTVVEEFRERRGGAVGVVTTVPFNHATPAAFVAHNKNRSNYYTGYRGFTGTGLADEIILETRPDVVIGGGHPLLDNPGFDQKKGYISERLLTLLRGSEEYVFVEREPGVDGGRALRSGAERAASGGRKLFGLFGGDGGSFELPEPADDPGRPAFTRPTRENPTLAEATVAALQVLSSRGRGFFLMVEQGDIDWANHDNDFRRMVGAMYDLEEAVKAAREFIDRPGDAVDWADTVFVVTADHGTGGLRLNPEKPLGPGDLPAQFPYDPKKMPPPGSDRLINGNGNGKPPVKKAFLSPYVYPDGEVEYFTIGHTNELVTLSVSGPAWKHFLGFEGLWYPGPIIDNTQVHSAVRKALGF
jgi:alkaline phosphatase